MLFIKASAGVRLRRKRPWVVRVAFYLNALRQAVAYLFEHAQGHERCAKPSSRRFLHLETIVTTACCCANTRRVRTLDGRLCRQDMEGTSPADLPVEEISTHKLLIDLRSRDMRRARP